MEKKREFNEHENNKFIILEGELREEIFEKSFYLYIIQYQELRLRKSYIIFPMLEIGNHKKNLRPI